MKLYTYAISANERIPNAVRITSTTGAIFAENENEALGSALNTAYERWPTGNDYYSHGVNVMVIPDSFILRAATYIQGRDEVPIQES